MLHARLTSLRSTRAPSRRAPRIRAMRRDPVGTVVGGAHASLGDLRAAAVDLPWARARSPVWQLCASTLFHRRRHRYCALPTQARLAPCKGDTGSRAGGLHVPTTRRAVFYDAARARGVGIRARSTAFRCHHRRTSSAIRWHESRATRGALCRPHSIDRPPIPTRSCRVAR
jgi:hypothetical protein